MDGPKSYDEIDPAAVPSEDLTLLNTLHPAIKSWWLAEFGASMETTDGVFTPPQREAIPQIQAGNNVLICSPTGSGKTLAAYTGILDALYRRGLEDRLENTVYALYISPLKSLVNDIHRNLAVPIEGIEDRLTDRGESVSIRHAIRHGDTSSSDRQAMLEETPHILNVTPETLAILLNAPKFREKLRSVEYVIVDEIHALAQNKRGTHLSVSLERLETVTEYSPVRIGCSATIEPLDTMADFLVGSDTPGGAPRSCDIVDTRFVRDFDIELECPVDDLAGTDQSVLQDRFFDRLHELIRAHTNTLVFTNTRSGAERILHNLRERFEYDESTSGCHHGSLSPERRQAVERQLKAGEIDVVTTSTSLELGIDMPHVDLVVQVGSPKSVAALLQRVGRAGHRLGQTVEGRVIGLDRDELIECAVMLDRAESGFVDGVQIPERAHDVAAQHVYGMAINEVRREESVRAILQRAYPYRNYTDTDWSRLMAYLTADYPGLESRNVYPKIWRDTNDPPGGEHHYDEYPVGTPLIGRRGRLARMIYLTNIGTIPDSFNCRVVTREDESWVGELDEEYLDTLAPGDVFVLGGQRYVFRYRQGSKVVVDPTDDRPTVPSWFSERLPLSPDLGREIRSFHERALIHHHAGGVPGLREWLREFPLNEHAVRAIARLIDEQCRFAGGQNISTTDRIAVETELDQEADRRRYYVHTIYGRQVNDGLSRLVATRCAHRTDATIRVAVADHGFSVSMPLTRKIDIADVLTSMDPDAVRSDLRAAVQGTDLFKRYFRINATRSLMILKRYKDYEKSAAEQQVDSEMLLSFAENLDGFAVIEETYRELLEDHLGIGEIKDMLTSIQNGTLEITTTKVSSPSPMAFGLATLIDSDRVLANTDDPIVAKFHEQVTAVIDRSDDDPRESSPSD